MYKAEYYDIMILGAGPGGYVAGIRAAQLGLKVCVVEKDKTGGVCLNVGCIPSKSLIHQANLFSSIKKLHEMKIKVDTKEFSYFKVNEKSRKVADVLSNGVKNLLIKNGVTLIYATGTIVDPHTIKLSDGKELKGTNIIIATGSRPKVIKGFEFDNETILSSTGILMLTELPQSIAILGGGAIGVEFAFILNSFGVKVSLIEMMDKMLPLEDGETVDILLRSFKRRGIKIFLGTKALSITKTNNGADILLEDKKGSRQTLNAQKVLSVFGRTPNVESIGLESVDIGVHNGFIEVGNYYQTKRENIYAIGDVVNTPLLAHVASYEGELVVEHIAGLDTPPHIIEDEIPAAVYTEPQLASFGPTEESLLAMGKQYSKAVFPYRGAGKSVALEKTEGQVKILYDTSTLNILAAHIVGAEASELIHEILLAKKAHLTTDIVADMIHAHPTLSETIMEAMKSVEKCAIHV